MGFQDKVREPARDAIAKPAGPIDPELCVIYARTNRGKPLGLMATTPCTRRGIPRVTEKDGRVVGMASADYWGICPHHAPPRRRPESAG